MCLKADEKLFLSFFSCETYVYFLKNGGAVNSELIAKGTTFWNRCLNVKGHADKLGPGVVLRLLAVARVRKRGAKACPYHQSSALIWEGSTSPNQYLRNGEL